MPMLTPEDQRYLLRVARESIRAALQNRPYRPAEREPLNQLERGLFVTLRKMGELRGCLGRFDAAGENLTALTARLAAEAAQYDQRFAPLQLNELPESDIHISLLTEPQRIDEADAIEVGRHGIKIEGRTLYGAKRIGTLLPQVAVENDWDARAFLSATCVKAGLNEDAWRDPRTDIYIYEAESFGDLDFSTPPFLLED